LKGGSIWGIRAERKHQR